MAATNTLYQSEVELTQMVAPRTALRDLRPGSLNWTHLTCGTRSPQVLR